MANIFKVTDNKRDYMDLLFLADEQMDMIERYLDKGIMYVIDDDGIKGECVVTDEGEGILEIKNIATAPESHGKGYGRLLKTDALVFSLQNPQINRKIRIIKRF